MTSSVRQHPVSVFWKYNSSQWCDWNQNFAVSFEWWKTLAPVEFGDEEEGLMISGPLRIFDIATFWNIFFYFKLDFNDNYNDTWNHFSQISCDGRHKSHQSQIKLCCTLRVSRLSLGSVDDSPRFNTYNVIVMNRGETSFIRWDYEQKGYKYGSPTIVYSVSPVTLSRFWRRFIYHGSINRGESLWILVMS